MSVVASLSAKLSVDSLMSLNPCSAYSREYVTELVKNSGFLLTIPAEDAWWALTRLLSNSNKVVWANACARRAEEYAAKYAASDASYAAAAARYAASDTGYADSYAARYATSAAARYASVAASVAGAAAKRAEEVESICHAVSLLECQ